MSQNQPNEPKSETAKQLEDSLDLLFELLLEEKQANPRSPATKEPAKEQADTESISAEKPAAGRSLRPSVGKVPSSRKSPRSKATEPTDLRQLIENLNQKLEKLEKQIYEPTEIINPLLPLITELLQNKTEVTRESLLQSLLPVVDEAIRQKTKQSPHAIGKAIAPEIAVAIQEQILIDRESISRTLGPQMGEAIKNQIVVERDAMVDALYPVIGNTISKYMVEVVKDINQKVETAFSPEGIKRKVRAKIQGVSEAELIFQEAMEYAVLAVFLIHKDSGLVIRDVQPETNFQLEADMIAGMLTAIRVFVNDSVAIPGEVSELHEIEYDASKIIIEVAGYCYLAVVVKGEPSKALLQKIRNTLGKIILDYGRAIEEYSGDPATVPDSLKPLLVNLVETKRKDERSSSSSGLLVLIFVLLSLILVPLGYFGYRSHSASQTESAIAEALDATPELSVYHIIPTVRQGEVILTGRVPNQYLQTKAAKIASEAAPDLELKNQIVAVDVPPDPMLTAAEVERTTALMNQREEVNITTRFDESTVTVTGSISNEGKIDQMVRGFEQIPGVSSVIATLDAEIPSLDATVYFEFGSAQLDRDASEKISTVKQFLTQNPQLNLNIIGHSDSAGARQNRQSLALRRAETVKQALSEQGVNPSRLQVSGSPDLPPNVTEAQPSRLSRVVRFETFIP